jgi:glyoxylase-like metal-dependent hydrolase (beta-lactamase superfamily II)
MAEITAFRVGHCTHPSCMALKGSGLKSRCFPSRAYLIETRSGLFLWDTGYADRFRAATASGIYRLYPLVTPVYFDAQESLQGQLRAHGVQPGDIHTLVLSHFHADHIAGMRDFPAARLLASAPGWDAVRRLSGLRAVRQGFVPQLLPPDVEARLAFVEQHKQSALPAELAPFTHGRDISGSGEIYVVDLPGHVVGHIGAFVRGDDGWTLLASDAAWLAESYQQLRGPSELSFLIQHDRAAYYRTLRKLHALHAGGKAAIRISHEGALDYVTHVEGDAP